MRQPHPTRKRSRRQPSSRRVSLSTLAELEGLRGRLHAEITRIHSLLRDCDDLPPDVRHSLKTLDIVAGSLTWSIRAMAERIVP